MTSADADIPETGAVFTLGKSRFADNEPSHFFIKNDPVVVISCGDEHTAVICQQGRVFVFGANEYGQLGLGHTETVSRPSCVKWLKPHRTLSVACGRSHTIFLTGCTFEFTRHNSPFSNRNSSNNRALGFDSQTGYYLENDHIYTTGNNSDGQLGTGNTENQSIPQYIEIDIPDVKVKQISAGSSHTALLTESGTTFVCGSNNEGQLGLGEKITHTTTLTEIKFESPIAFIECGAYFTVFITVDGIVYICGENDNQKLGISNRAKFIFKPEKIAIDVPIKSSCCGANHVFLLSEDETKVYAFGSNEYGQLGLPNVVVEVTAPTEACWDKMFDGSPVKLIACGATHTAFVTENGQLYTCGDSRHGKLGLDELTDENCNQFLPKRSTLLEDYEVENVACGGCHTIIAASKVSKRTTKESRANVAMLKELPPLQKVPASLMSKLDNNHDENDHVNSNGNEDDSTPHNNSVINGNSEEDKSIDSLEGNVSDSHIVEINKIDAFSDVAEQLIPGQIDDSDLKKPHLERQDTVLEVHTEQRVSKNGEDCHCEDRLRNDEVISSGSPRKTPTLQKLSMKDNTKTSPELSPKSEISQKSDYSKSENETIICYSDKSSPPDVKLAKTLAVIPIVRAEDTLPMAETAAVIVDEEGVVSAVPEEKQGRFSKIFQSVRDKENSCMGKGKEVFSSVNVKKESIDTSIDKIEDKLEKTETAIKTGINNEVNSRACAIL